MGRSANNGHYFDTERFAPTSWGRSSANENDKPYEYTTASGQLVLIKKISMTEIFRLGLMDSLDFFIAGLVESDKKVDEKAAQEAANSPDFTKKLLGNFDKLEVTVNKVLMTAVIAPVIAPAPTDPAAERKDGVIYVDRIPFEDRVELFGEILDTEGLSDFREESANDMGHVQDIQSVQLPAEHAAGGTD